MSEATEYKWVRRLLERGPSTVDGASMGSSPGPAVRMARTDLRQLKAGTLSEGHSNVVGIWYLEEEHPPGDVLEELLSQHPEVAEMPDNKVVHALKGHSDELAEEWQRSRSSIRRQEATH